ncbi:MAG: low molecular weight phosphotyrosine protein phosphatase [Betaproteobacteria bacterium]|nr:low molecular weight phosphotyrosine protein phosphatase [Betaproteobacteria bacterium]
MSTRVLFVCMGNICRSPMAEGVFRQMVRQAGLDEVVSMESAGTHAFHAGESADKRAIAAAQKRGVDITAHRARSVDVNSFDQYDLILAMDWDNLSFLQQKSAKKPPSGGFIAPSACLSKTKPFVQVGNS